MINVLRQDVSLVVPGLLYNYTYFTGAPSNAE